MLEGKCQREVEGVNRNMIQKASPKIVLYEVTYLTPICKGADLTWNRLMEDLKSRVVPDWATLACTFLEDQSLPYPVLEPSLSYR